MIHLGRLRQELTFTESIEKSKELADLVSQNYSPDLVVAIASGGILPANEISKRINVKYSEFTVRRNTPLAQLYKSASRITRPFVRLYDDYLFMTVNPSLIDAGNFNCNDMKVLLVDDSVHTGKTLRIATDTLVKKGASQIKTAAISHINGTSPDYYLTKGRIKFPWSKDSNDYQTFLSYIESVQK